MLWSMKISTVAVSSSLWWRNCEYHLNWKLDIFIKCIVYCGTNEIWFDNVDISIRLLLKTSTNLHTNVISSDLFNDGELEITKREKVSRSFYFDVWVGMKFGSCKYLRNLGRGSWSQICNLHSLRLHLYASESFLTFSRKLDVWVEV